MALAQPTFEGYQAQGGARLEAHAFDLALPEALARVKARCAAHNLETLSDADTAAFLRAVYAACEAVADPAAVSWKAGNTSMEYADAASMGVDSAIERALSGSRLASCWV